MMKSNKALEANRSNYNFNGAEMAHAAFHAALTERETTLQSKVTWKLLLHEAVLKLGDGYQSTTAKFIFLQLLFTANGFSFKSK